MNLEARNQKMLRIPIKIGRIGGACIEENQEAFQNWKRKHTLVGMCGVFFLFFFIIKPQLYLASCYLGVG